VFPEATVKQRSISSITTKSLKTNHGKINSLMSLFKEWQIFLSTTNLNFFFMIGQILNFQPNSFHVRFSSFYRFEKLKRNHFRSDFFTGYQHIVENFGSAKRFFEKVFDFPCSNHKIQEIDLIDKKKNVL
jgi:hypothetical protein